MSVLPPSPYERALEQERLDGPQELQRYEVVGRPPDRELQAIVDLVALSCGVPNAAINLLTSAHQHQVATAGIDPSVCAREDSMCAAVLEDPSTVIVPNATEDARFRDNPFVTGELGDVRFYASAPLTTPRGATIGRLCVFDSAPHELTEQQGRVLRVLAARIIDLLELRLRSRELEQSLADLTEARDELRRSNELLSLFAGQVSHDLRSPLTAILTNCELLVDEPAVAADPDVLSLVDGTLAAGRRMTVMIAEILAYARVGARLEVRELALDDVLDDVLRDLRPIVVERRAKVIRDPLPTVRADRQQLYAVLLNLVSNALKFAPATTVPVVELGAELVDDRGEPRWRICVGDNGRGIPVDRRESVFELYARDDVTVAGSGIGLATARRAVEAHGGRMGIGDSPLGGASVWFTLPA